MRASLAWYIATSARCSSASALGAVLRAQRGADARVHHDLEPFDLERVLERDADPAPDVRRPREPGAGQQQRELVAAEAGDEPAARRPPPAGAAPRLASRQVAGVMAERVVEVLEAVEVDHRDGEPAVALVQLRGAAARGTRGGSRARSARR